jgi:hypothetical protein
MGRVTLAAILAEVQSGAEDGTPEIEVSQGAAGRETLAAIAEDVLPRAVRPRRRTLGFEEPRPERITGGPSHQGASAGKPGVESVARSPRRASTASESAASAPSGAISPEVEAFEIHEMVTFVVRGDLARLSSERARRSFVRDHLAHRLPVATFDDVDRIDVTPWTVKGTVVVRVWCRVAPAPPAP